MARSQVSTAVKFTGACAAVIVGGATIGYLFNNARDTHPQQQTTQPPVSSTLAPTPSVNPSSVHPHTANGNYTAPGAPHIVIEEESQPILRRVASPTPPPPDPEATQEATKPTVTTPPPTPAVKPADAANTGQSGATPVTSPAAGGTDTNSGASNAPTPAPISPPSPPADPDFEHVNGPKPPAAGSSDPESGQQGGSPGQRTQNDDGRSDGGRVQFRVQTGAYTDESNARSVADSLRSQGYATSTRSEQDGDHLVYKVQVGAYRSKTGASKAADDLQRKGYPAYVSPVAE